VSHHVAKILLKPRPATILCGGEWGMATEIPRRLKPPQRALLLKMWKYYDKHKDMIEEYKKDTTRELAVTKYSNIFPVRAPRYEKAWKRMPKVYEERMSDIDNRIRNWIITWSKKMFDVVPTKEEVEEILNEIKKLAVA
jgi:hypothetical protein